MAPGQISGDLLTVIATHIGLLRPQGQGQPMDHLNLAHNAPPATLRVQVSFVQTAIFSQSYINIM